MQKKVTISIWVIILLFVISILFIYPSIYQYICKNRVYTDIQNGMKQYESANVCIIRRTVTDEECYGYSVGASGVIFKQKDDEYYALTAYHVIKEQKNTTYLIQTVNDKSIPEYRKLHPEEGHTSLEEYYGNFPVCDIVYTDETADIAIIMFKSLQKLSVISLAAINPEKGTRVVCVGQDGNQNIHFCKTYGNVISGKLENFDAADGQSENKIIKVNAYGTSGFSGGAVIDEYMKLVGINIGGGTDFLGRFKYEAIVPCEQLNKCIQEFEACIE